MLQASVLDCVAFDPFSFQQDCLTAPEVDVGRRQIAQALVIAPMVVVIDEPVDAGLKITRQVVVFQKDAVLERLMPTFDLSLCLRMIGRATNLAHVLMLFVTPASVAIGPSPHSSSCGPPLFAPGLRALGLLKWRRKRKASALAV